MVVQQDTILYVTVADHYSYIAGVSRAEAKRLVGCLRRRGSAASQMTGMVWPVVQGLLAVGGMRPWCGAAVGVPSIRF